MNFSTLTTIVLETGAPTVDEVGRAVYKAVRRDEAFEILDKDGEGGDWSTGGCMILADAIMLVLSKLGMPGNLMAMVGSDGALDHALVQAGGKLLDARGARRPASVISYWKFEMPDEKIRIVNFEDAKPSPEIPRRPVASQKVAKLILSELGVNEARTDAPSRPIARKLMFTIADMVKEYQQKRYGSFSRELHWTENIAGKEIEFSVELEANTGYRGKPHVLKNTTGNVDLASRDNPSKLAMKIEIQFNPKMPLSSLAPVIQELVSHEVYHALHHGKTWDYEGEEEMPWDYVDSQLAHMVQNQEEIQAQLTGMYKVAKATRTPLHKVIREKVKTARQDDIASGQYDAGEATVQAKDTLEILLKAAKARYPGIFSSPPKM